MSEQPFQDSEIVWRWKPDARHDYVFTYHGDMVKVLWLGDDGHWYQSLYPPEVAQLLRELTEARQERDRLEVLCSELVSAKWDNERLRAMERIERELKPAQPQAADGGKE